MERFRYDRSSKWLITHHGNHILYLGNVRDVVAWKPGPGEVVQPRKLPDGLLDVKRRGDSQYHPYIVEIETYADRRVPEDLLDDMMLVYQDRRELPDVMVVVLRPKGNVEVNADIEVQSRGRLAKLSASWQVVPVWEVDGAQLLATEEPGLMPWVPLTKLEGPPEPIFQECRRVIDEKGSQAEHDNLLAVTQVLMGLVYNDQRLFDIFGGKEAMIESPVLNNLIDEQVTERLAKQNFALVVEVLQDRFETLPSEVVEQLRSISDPQRLKELVREAAKSADLDSFRQKLQV